MDQWGLADRDAVNQYNNKIPEAQGPSHEMMLLDLHIVGITRWTKRLAIIFEVDFFKERRLGSYPLLTVTVQPGDAVLAFIQYSLHLKEYYSRNVVNRLQAGASDKKRQTRTHSRRQQVHIIRFDMIISDPSP